MFCLAACREGHPCAGSRMGLGCRLQPLGCRQLGANWRLLVEPVPDRTHPSPQEGSWRGLLSQDVFPRCKNSQSKEENLHLSLEYLHHAIA